MKTIAVVSALAAVLSTFVGQASARAAEETSPPTGGGAAEATIRKLTDKLTRAALKGDAAVMDQLHANDYVSISAITGATSTKADLINNYKSGKLKYESLDVSESKIKLYSPTTALVTARVTAKGKLGDHDFAGTYWSARLWVKRSGKWQVVFLQSTQVPAQALAG